MISRERSGAWEYVPNRLLALNWKRRGALDDARLDARETEREVERERTTGEREREREEAREGEPEVNDMMSALSSSEESREMTFLRGIWLDMQINFWECGKEVWEYLLCVGELELRFPSSPLPLPLPIYINMGAVPVGLFSVSAVFYRSHGLHRIQRRHLISQIWGSCRRTPF